MHMALYSSTCLYFCVATIHFICMCWREDYYPLPPCINPPLIQCQRPDPNMAERQHVTCLAALLAPGCGGGGGGPV